MVLRIEPAVISFEDGTPYAPVYDDVYHSRAGAIAQARQVFLGGNRLPQRWANAHLRDHFVIVETGFGLGLNFLATWAAWREQTESGTASAGCQRLHFISVEKHPLFSDDLARLLAPYRETLPNDCIDALIKQWPMLTEGTHRLAFDDDRIILTLMLGDAETALTNLSARADAIYLDGFSPVKNPEIWSDKVCQALARLSGGDTTVATWSVNGALRRRLTAHGFELTLRPGFAQKREMLTGVFRERRPHPNPGLPVGHALIVGAGLAGTASAERLSARGWQCTILEANTLASGASGNQAGVIRPLPSIDDNILARLTRAGFLATLGRLQQLAAAGHPVQWDDCGVLHLARDTAQAEVMQRTVQALEVPGELLQWVEQSAASALAHLPLSSGGWWFPAGGWVNPADYCRQLLAISGAQLREHTMVNSIHQMTDGWVACDTHGQPLVKADIVVLANATQAPHLAAPFSQALPIRAARGQTTVFAAPPGPAPRTVLCRQGYWTPAIAGQSTSGASFIVDDVCPDLRLEEHAENLHALAAMMQEDKWALPAPTAPTLRGKVGWRPVVPDRLPLVGQLPAINHAALPSQSRAARGRVTGLYVNNGFGARGILFATLCAEVLACQIGGEPLPIDKDLARAIDPMRYAHKKPYK